MDHAPRKHIFVSYAQEDANRVDEFVHLLASQLGYIDAPVDLWMDREALRPGEQWADAIQAALLDSVGMLVFVSPASMASEWVRRELEAAASSPERMIVPIILHHVADLPFD